MVTIDAADIYSITNTAVAEENLHRKAHKHFRNLREQSDRHDLTIADCEFEFTTLQKTADTSHTVSHGFLHSKDYKSRAGTLGRGRWSHFHAPCIFHS